MVLSTNKNNLSRAFYRCDHNLNENSSIKTLNSAKVSTPFDYQFVILEHFSLRVWGVCCLFIKCLRRHESINSDLHNAQCTAELLTFHHAHNNTFHRNFWLKWRKDFIIIIWAVVYAFRAFNSHPFSLHSGCRWERI